jgi:hypothetical protein
VVGFWRFVDVEDFYDLFICNFFVFVCGVVFVGIFVGFVTC